MWSTNSLQDSTFHNNNGQEIVFEFDFNYEKNSRFKSLWSVHKLTAFIDDNPVGYITVSYIPEATWNDIVESKPLHPALVASEHIGGNSLGIRGAQSFPSEHSILQKLSLSVAYSMNSVFTKENVGTREYNEAKEFVLNRSIRKYKESYQNSYDFHVEKPMVDYINTNDEYKRQGIGHALYYAMALIVAENGYRMRSSGLKTKDGSAHFKAFSRNYPEIITKEDGYYFIDTNLKENMDFAC